MSCTKRLFAEFIADAVCPPWRRDLKAGDAEVWDDVPVSNWDPVALKWTKAAETALSFHVWEVTREAGLIYKLRIAFGDKAVREYDRSGLGTWSFSGIEERIFVQVQLEPTKVPVPGSMTKYKSTANRIKRDIEDSIYDYHRKSNAIVLPSVRINVSEKKK